jgi:hypothetical protein
VQLLRRGLREDRQGRTAIPYGAEGRAGAVHVLDVRYGAEAASSNGDGYTEGLGVYSMTWVELKNKKVRQNRCRCPKRPKLWPWSKIDFGSIWRCDTCDKQWIVAGKIEESTFHRFWSTNIYLWQSVAGSEES